MTPRLAKQYERELLDEHQIDPRNETVQQLIEAYSPELDFDESILGRIERLVDEYNTLMRANFELRYYQVLALYFTECFFEEQASANGDPQNMLAYWMATGSGKTLVMHLNILQHLRRLKRTDVDYDVLQIVFTTPSKNLIGQHERELRPYVDALNRRYSNRIELLIDTTQGLIQHDDSYFALEGNLTHRLVLVDEGHIGLGSTGETVFKNLRDTLNERNSFLFEYSATYHNVGSREVEEEYERAIVFDYNYSRFYRDGYGKDYYFRRIGTDVVDDEKDNLDECFRVLQQKMKAHQELLELDEQELSAHFQENVPSRPLAAFMGRTVDPGSSAKDETSDVGKVIQYLATLTPVERRAFRDVFQGDITGPLVLTRNHHVEDELLLAFGDGEKWGIVNVGDAAKFFRDFEHPDVEKRQDAILDDRYLFQNVDDLDSPINVLIGSRKFAEGWNCFRLSVTGLLNLGSSKGNQIIQIFGRGVRLHGAEGNGKRSYADHVEDYYALDDTVEGNIRRVETLTVFSLKRSYLEQFIKEIQEEIRPRLSFTLRVNPKIMKLGEEELTFEAYRDHLPIFKTRKRDIGWKRVVLNAGSFTYSEMEDEGLSGEFERYRVRLDYRPDRDQDGHDVRARLYNEDHDQSLYHRFKPFLDQAGWARAIRDAADKAKIALYARAGGDSLRVARFEDLIQLVESIRYKSLLDDAGPAIIDRLGQKVLEDVIGKVKNKIHYDINRRNYIFNEPLQLSDADTAGDIIYEYVVTHEFDTHDELEAFELELDKKKAEIQEALQFGPIREHLYEPLLDEIEASDDVRVSPDALNAGEKKFVHDLSEYVSDRFGDAERFGFYLLRNVESLKSIGIFLENDEGTFYPDFVLWVIDHESDSVVVALVDPKGEQGMVDASRLGANEKVNLALKNDDHPSLRELEEELSNEHEAGLTLHSFLLLRDTSEMGKARDDDWIQKNMLKRNVFRLDWHDRDEKGDPSQKWNGQSYVDLLFEKAGLLERSL